MFEGPLDLLLYLIKKNHIDICDIPIAEVTEQYLGFIEMMKMLNLDVVGDFLVMAATLMQIKSKMLLPPDPLEEQEQEEDPRDELVQRLLEYKRFKEIAEELKDKESKRQDLFARRLDEDIARELKEEAKEVYFEVSLFDLINALTKALKKIPQDSPYELTEEEYTVDEKVHSILHILVNQPQIRMSYLFNQARNKLEAIVTFIAVLELIRLKEITVIQKRLFDDIELARNKGHVVATS